ncbi:hypothetical protein FM042_08060 [Aliidiomarina halalkaliphila]|uniref:DUF6161 domain-containing protein n=1 Tax=Aliidiomarina halalkaliphila TaxID=2593535 RepID=A0A552X1M3_9GAMM|nr:DUF6161 domain-containing protein [Aliidiomarina halalkaliphila]TRW48927.1 hypothetical protein FM042_08060 [Aliidiomarina halalkaliphila]
MADSISYSIKDASGEDFPFTSLKGLKDFIRNEIEFWQEAKKLFPSNTDILRFIDGAQHLKSFYTAISEISSNSRNIDPDELNSMIQSLTQKHLRNIQQYWLSRTHSYISAYIRCAQEHGGEAAAAFFAYAIGKNVSNIQQKSVLVGVFAAYEFFDASDEHLSRKRGEKISLSKLRNDLQRARDELFSDIEQLKDDSRKWSENSKRKQIRRYRAQKVLSEKLRKNEKEEFVSQKEYWDNEFKDLRKVHADQLRLEEPAKYWSDAGKKFRNQGIIFTIILLVLIGLGLYGVYSILSLWMEKGETPLSLASLQGVVLFGSLAAIFAYGVRVTSRMAFSSFHLMRDAEERHQLTYLYLSLINETQSDERAREIILQALFSRSETGLLVTENGPTMPGIRDLAKGS